MSVLIKPIITEKMTADSELFNRYGFIVDPKANKLPLLFQQNHYLKITELL